MKTKKIAMILILILVVLLQAPGAVLTSAAETEPVSASATVPISAAGIVPIDASETDLAFAPENVSTSTSEADSAPVSATVLTIDVSEETGTSAAISPAHVESIAQQPEPSEYTAPADLPDPSIVQAAEESPDILEPSQQPDPAEFTLPADLPDTLTVKTGFANAGPDDYQEVRSFGLSELETLDLYLTDYTFLDEEGRLYVVRAKGFLLTDLLREAGIELEDVSSLHFLSSTQEGDRMVSFSKEELLDTTRLCNYSLVNYYEEETGTLAEHKRWMAAETDVMIALQDSWILASEGGSFEEDGEELLVPRNRFRLIFGQTDCLEREAERAIGGIHTILAQYAGEAPEEMDTTGMSGEEADPGLPEEDPVSEKSANGEKQGDEGSPSAKEGNDWNLPEAEPLMSLESPEKKPGQQLIGSLTDRIRKALSAPETDTKNAKSNPVGDFSDQELAQPLPLPETSAGSLQKENAGPLEAEENTTLPETAHDAKEPERTISIDRQKEGNLLQEEAPEANARKNPDTEEKLLETQEIPEMPETISSPAGGSQERTRYQTASDRQNTATSEPVRQNGITFEKFPVSMTSESTGESRTETLQTEGWNMEAAEEKMEEEQSAASTDPLTSAEELPQTEAQHLIPITILDTDMAESDNPLLKPVGWMALVIFLLGGLMEYIRYCRRYDRETRSLYKKYKKYFSARRLWMAETRFLSENDEPETWRTKPGAFPFTGGCRELSEAGMK